MSTPSNSPRERILRSARTLFAAKGYEHASTSAIARDAGTSESQMMKYFGSKLGLLQAIFEQAWSEITPQARAAGEGAATGPEKIRAMIGVLLAFVRREPEMRLLFLLESRRVRRDDHSVALSSGYIGFIALVDEVLEGMRRWDPEARTQPAGCALGAVRHARRAGSRRGVKRAPGTRISMGARRSAASLRPHVIGLHLRAASLVDFVRQFQLDGLRLQALPVIARLIAKLAGDRAGRWRRGSARAEMRDDLKRAVENGQRLL